MGFESGPRSGESPASADRIVDPYVHRFANLAEAFDACLAERIAAPHVKRIELDAAGWAELQDLLRRPEGRERIKRLGQVRFTTRDPNVQQGLMALHGKEVKKLDPASAPRLAEETRVSVHGVLGNRQAGKLKGFDDGWYAQAPERLTVKQREQKLREDLAFFEGKISREQTDPIPLKLDHPSETMLVDTAKFFVKHPGKIEFHPDTMRMLENVKPKLLPRGHADAKREEKMLAKLDEAKAAMARKKLPMLSFKEGEKAVFSPAVAKAILELAVIAPADCWETESQETPKKKAARQPQPAPRREPQAPSKTRPAAPASSRDPKTEPKYPDVWGYGAEPQEPKAPRKGWLSSAWSALTGK